MKMIIGRNVLHVLGQSHIDLAWFWPYYPETIYDCARTTFMRAVDNLEFHEEFTFAQSQVPLYEDVEKYFPELFLKIAKYVEEGRWSIVGGMYVEAEGGEPCGESLVRQCVFGQRFFIKKFGRKTNVGWLPDSWTHPWQLPQILKKSGMNYLVLNRGCKGDQLFWWESPDGSRILACKPLRGFFGHGPFPNVEKMVRDVSLKYGIKDIFMVIGSGDHGGGPTYQEIQNIKDLASNLKDKLTIKFSTPEEYFKEISKVAHKLPILREELDFELVGDLTNVAELKKENRFCENLLIAAERFSSIAAILTCFAYPQSTLNEAWRKVLFNQFHDIIGGSVIPAGQNYAHEFYLEALRTGGAVLKGALEAISSLVEVPEGVYVIVFNSLSWDRTDLVEVEVEVPKDWKTFKLLDPEGRVTPIQIVGFKKDMDKERIMLIFEAEDIPSMGYKTYTLVPSDQMNHSNIVRADEQEMENVFFRVKISPVTGNITSIFDKEDNREIISEGGEGNVIRLIEDMGDSEGRLFAGIDRSNEFTGFVWDVKSKPSIKVLESGPVRCRVSISRDFQNSKYVSEILLYSKIKRVDFRLVVSWHEIHKALKVAFPLNIVDPVLTFEMQYGSVTRQATGEEQPMQQWVDMSNSDGSYGASLLNDSKYACDVRGNTIRLTILRSPTEPAYNTDEGIHEVKYSLFPHSRAWKTSGVARKGYEFNNPLIPIVGAFTRAMGSNTRKLPKSYSFLHTEPENLIVTTFKKAEEGESFVLRLYEVAGKETQANISFNLGKIIREAHKTDLLEDEEMDDEVNIEKNLLEFKVSPYEIATIKLDMVLHPYQDSYGGCKNI